MIRKSVLLLNADYSPMKLVPWEHAVEMVLEGKVITVESYEGEYVRSERLAVPWPAVVALKRYKTVKSRVKFSARNVVLRDGGVCSYCGIRPRTSDGRIDRTMLTFDHVIPRAQNDNGAVYLPWSKKWVNVTCWENATTACRRCNMQKGARSPQQAGMTLRSVPRIPTSNDVMRMNLTRLRNVPREWEQYLPPGWLEALPDSEREERTTCAKT